MKVLLVTLFISILTLCNASEVIDLKKKRLPAIKLDYTNSILLEQVANSVSSGRGRDRAKSIQVTLNCHKKLKVRGRDSSKSYQCTPVEMVVPAPTK